jgi:hypothetical protein
LADPIYKDPASNYGRAHFYAPIKKLGTLEIDTYWYNIMVMWFFCIVLYVMLLTDAIRKLIESFGKKS